VRGRPLTPRAIALTAAASAAIHQARYSIGYGSGAEHELAARGHGYLSVAVPVIVAALVLALASLLMRAARGRATKADGSFTALWLAVAIALAAIFAVQESIEGASAVAHGGWIGLALAVPAGLLVALALRGAAAAEASAGHGVHLGFTVLMDALPGIPPSPHPGCVGAFVFGARAPPTACVV
jgi:hypothetical protein